MRPEAGPVVARGLWGRLREASAGQGQGSQVQVWLPAHLEPFDAQRWAGLSPGERVRGLQGLEDHMAGVQGRAARPVVLDTGLGDRSYGRFDGRLCLNPRLVGEGSSPYRAVQTVLHEGRHAFQRNAADGKVRGVAVPAETVGSWRDNYQPGAYNDPKLVEFYDYRFHPIEDDASKFATSAMESVSSYFAHDPGYRQFLTAEATETADLEQDAAEAWDGADFREKIAADISARADRSRQQTREAWQSRATQQSHGVSTDRVRLSFPVPADQAEGWRQPAPAVRRGGWSAGRGPSRGGQER